MATGAQGRPLYGIPVADQGQHRRRGPADHRRLPGLRLRAGKTPPPWRGCARAGAIVIGKTNLDQFATGLVGVRTPYGVRATPFDPALIPGGSSSGSAVAVAAGLVPLALGTDTAGSGRVPAALNNIVGLKPSLGAGLDRRRGAGLPHARLRLDLRADRRRRLDRARSDRRADAADPYSRARPLGALGRSRKACGSACRSPASGCSSAIAPRRTPTMRRWRAAPHSARRLSRSTSSRSTRPRACSTKGPGSRSAISSCARCWRRRRTRSIRSRGRSSGGRAAERRRCLRGILPAGRAAPRPRPRCSGRSMRCCCRPRPRSTRVEQVLADPIQLNSRLGTYTNFVNLLDLCGLAVPAAMRADGMPFGVTLLAPAGHDALLASSAAHSMPTPVCRSARLGLPQPPLPVSRRARARTRSPSPPSARICPACRSTAS